MLASLIFDDQGEDKEMFRSLVALTLIGVLAGCVVDPAASPYYGYGYGNDYDYPYGYGYAPGYYDYGGPSVALGFGYWGGGGHHHWDHDRDWHGDRGWHGGHGGGWGGGHGWGHR
jgi:hypothetical protein